MYILQIPKALARRIVVLLLLLSLAYNNGLNAQNSSHLHFLNIGDTAPPLRVSEWVKGKPVLKFEKGKIYVVDFWATWCGYCIVGMPYFTKTARKFRRKAVFTSINVWEREGTNADKIKHFVDSMGSKMRYRVALDDSGFMAEKWLDAAGEWGIPSCFVVDKNGKIAWIGHPAELEKKLPEIMHHTWDLQAALKERMENKNLAILERKTWRSTFPFTPSKYMKDFFGEPDSVLAIIAEAVNKDPKLQYEGQVVHEKFHALLRIDFNQAYEYGKMVLNYNSNGYDGIIWALIDYPYEYNSVPKKLFQLGGDAMQKRLEEDPWDLKKTPDNYFRMAEWYFKAGNVSESKKAMKKALKALNKQKKIRDENLKKVEQGSHENFSLNKES